MAKLSMAQAAKRFDVSRATLAKHLSAGKISGERDAVGTWQLDVSELSRVYRLRGAAAPAEAAPVAGGGTEALQGEIKLLQARLEAAEQLAEERARHLDDLRKLLGQERPARRSWFPWGR